MTNDDDHHDESKAVPEPSEEATKRSSDLPLTFRPASRPPIYFGVTRPMGTPVKVVVSQMERLLDEAGYFLVIVKISEQMEAVLEDGSSTNDTRTADDPFDRYVALMKKGDLLRASLGRSIGADLAIKEIARQRGLNYEQESVRGKSPAYLITSFVHPEEVERFQLVYGPRFFLIGINAPLALRQRVLTAALSKGAKNLSLEEVSKRVATLIQIDSGAALLE